tara:strand:+ start:428 stop:847 length:420 start_codon:yes stop_codon:yes gene_type:complete
MAMRDASISEAARRLLKGDDCSIEIPFNHFSSAKQLALLINEELPQMLKEPKIIQSNLENNMRIYSNGELIVYLGDIEPEISVCWIPIFGDDFELIWNDFRLIIRDLLSAGYPGCIDCAGPAATEPWDEQSHRKIFRTG